MKRVVICLALSGCAHAYWIPTKTPTKYTGTREVDADTLAKISGLDYLIWGYFDRSTGIAYVLNTVPERAKPCIRAHEKYHAGFDHGPERLEFIDCGNGSWLSTETIQRIE